MRYDYNLELNNFTNILYKEMIFKFLLDDNTIDASNSDIKKIKEFLLEKKVYLGSGMDDFIINLIPVGHDGNMFRCAVAEHHKHIHPIFETQGGEKFVDPTYNNFGLLMFESHMNDLLISDLQSKFSQSEYEYFVINNLEHCYEEITSRILDTKKNSSVVINFDEKQNLLQIVKNMITNKELDIEYAYKLVDMDKLRDHMIHMSVTFEYYDEFDKLEEDTRFCLDNFCKYNSIELYNLLVNECGFECINEGTIIKR